MKRKLLLSLLVATAAFAVCNVAHGQAATGAITASVNFPLLGEPLTLEAPTGTSYQWYKLNAAGPQAIPLATESTYTFPALVGGDAGVYAVNYGTDLWAYYEVNEPALESELPVAGLVGLGLLAGAGLLGGLLRNRKK